MHTFYLLTASAKSSKESLIPIDNIIPPRAGAYNSLDTLHKSLFLLTLGSKRSYNELTCGKEYHYSYKKEQI